MKLPTSVAAAAKSAAVIAPAPVRPGPASALPVRASAQDGTWGRREWWILGLGLAVSAVIAAAIAWS